MAFGQWGVKLVPPERSRDNDGLHAWLQMILLSWNIQWGLGVDGRVDLDRIVVHARRFGDFDVLMLQEVADGYPELKGADGSDQFAALAQRLPGYTVVDGVATDTPRPGGGRRRFGNLIASRLPVLQVFRHLLPWPADPGLQSMQRIAIEISVGAPFGPLRVTTTHLEYYSAPQRAAQAERLRELHREAVQQSRIRRPGTPADGAFAALPRGGPAVLAGDFNCTPESAERMRLLEPFDDATPAYVDAWDLLHRGETRAPTLGVYDHVQWPEGPRTFDFMLVSADLAPRVRRVEVDASSNASDHQPVLIEL